MLQPPIKEDRFFRALVENSQGVIWLLDRNMRILFRSGFAQKISGWSDEELAEVPFDLMHPEMVAQVKAVMADALANPGQAFQLEFKMRHKGGWYLCLEGTITNLLEDPAVEGIVGNLHDITARKQAEEKLLQRNRLYYFMSQMNQAIVKAGDELTLFGNACQIAVTAGKFRMAWIGRVDETGEHIEPVCRAGEGAEYFLGPEAMTIRDGRYYVCNDIETAPEMEPWREAARGQCYRSSIGLPLKQGGKVVALFGLYADRINFFDEEEITLLERISSDISFALELFRQAILHKKIEDAFETTMNRISDGVVALDKEWRYTFLNDAALALHPMGREGALGRSVWEVHPAMKGTIFWDKYHEAMEQRKVVEFEVYYDLGKTWFSIRAYPSEDGLTVYYKDVTEQKDSELRLKESEEQLRKLAAHLQDIREEERTGIARDIHDDLGQQLTAVRIALYRLSKQVAGNADAEEGIRGVIELIGKGIESIRRISTQLRPVILEDLGLEEAMKWQIEEFEKRLSIPVKAFFNGPVQEIDPKIAINLFRIFQEALTNIARHSCATLVTVRYEADGERISLEVADNGNGLNPEEIRTKRTLGLLGMKERALMIGGDFRIEGQPGKGTRMQIRVPIDKTNGVYADTHS